MSDERPDAKTFEERLQRTREDLEGKLADGLPIAEVLEYIERVIAAGEGEYAKFSPPFYVATLRAERDRLRKQLS